MPAHSTLFKNLHSMTRERASRAYEAMVRATVEEDLPFIAFDCPYARTLRDRDPAVVAPCSRTLIETYVPRVCASIEHAVKKELERARHLMPTVDGWKKDRMHLNAVVVCTPAPIFIDVYRANDREDGPTPTFVAVNEGGDAQQTALRQVERAPGPSVRRLGRRTSAQETESPMHGHGSVHGGQTEDTGAPTELQPAPFPDLFDAANDVRRELENQFELGDSEGIADDAGEGGVQGSAVAPAARQGAPAPLPAPRPRRHPPQRWIIRRW